MLSSCGFTLSVGAEQKDVLKKSYMFYPIQPGHCIGKEEQLYLKLPVEVPDPNPISKADPSYALLLSISSCFKPLPKALNQSQGLEWQFAVICRALLSNSFITFDDLTKTHIRTLELSLFPLVTFPSEEINFEVKEICCTSKWACGQVPITEQIKRRGYLHAPWHTSFAASAFTMIQTSSSHDQKLS